MDLKIEWWIFSGAAASRFGFFLPGTGFGLGSVTGSRKGYVFSVFVLK